MVAEGWRSGGEATTRRMGRPFALVTVALLLVVALAAWIAQHDDGNDISSVVVNVPLTVEPHTVVHPSMAEPLLAATPQTASVTLGEALAGTKSATLTSGSSPVPPASVVLRPEFAGTGEAMLVSVSGPDVDTVTLRFRGEVIPLVAKGDLFWAVVGVPITAQAGVETLSLELRAISGAVIATITRDYEVVVVERPIDYLELSDELVNTVLTVEAAKEERRLRALQFATFDSARRWHSVFRLPVKGIVTTEFGQARSINGGAVGGHHTGTDIANELGTPVIASAPGRVAWTGEMPIRGISVLIDHGAGVMSGYHHLDKSIVVEGAFVEAGLVIGELGSSGLSTGPHLHWELTVWGTNVDPVTWTERDYSP